MLEQKFLPKKFFFVLFTDVLPQKNLGFVFGSGSRPKPKPKNPQKNKYQTQTQKPKDPKKLKRMVA